MKKITAELFFCKDGVQLLSEASPSTESFKEETIIFEASTNNITEFKSLARLAHGNIGYFHILKVETIRP